MEIKRTKNYVEFNASDDNGIYLVQIQSDGSQLRLITEDGNTHNFIDTNKKELTAIRDAIDMVIKKLK